MTDVALAVCQELAIYAREHSLEEADCLLMEIMAVLHRRQGRALPIQQQDA